MAADPLAPERHDDPEPRIDALQRSLARAVALAQRERRCPTRALLLERLAGDACLRAAADLVDVLTLEREAAVARAELAERELARLRGAGAP